MDEFAATGLNSAGVAGGTTKVGGGVYNAGTVTLTGHPERRRRRHLRL